MLLLSRSPTLVGPRNGSGAPETCSSRAIVRGFRSRTWLRRERRRRFSSDRRRRTDAQNRRSARPSPLDSPFPFIAREARAQATTAIGASRANSATPNGSDASPEQTRGAASESGYRRRSGKHRFLVGEAERQAPASPRQRESRGAAFRWAEDLRHRKHAICTRRYLDKHCDIAR